MSHWRRLAVAAALAVAFIPSGPTAFGAPPTTPTPPNDAASPAPDDTVPSEPLGDDVLADGVVHSWALAPAGTDETGVSRPNLSYSGAPGTVIEDAVTLFNFGNEDLPFRVYATDAFNNETGAFTLLTGDEAPRDVGTWITLPIENITVPAGKQATIPIVITIPAGARTGDHAGAVLASSSTLGLGEEQELLTFDRRAGTRVFVRVSGEIEPELTIDQLSTDYAHARNPLAGSATVAYRIQNRGNVRLSGVTEIEIGGPFGIGSQIVGTEEFDDLLPGESFEVVVDAADVPALGLVSTTARVRDLVAGDGGELDGATASQRSFAPPITLLLAALLLIFAIVAFRAVRRQRRGRIPVVPLPAREPADDELQPAP